MPAETAAAVLIAGVVSTPRNPRRWVRGVFQRCCGRALAQIDVEGRQSWVLDLTSDVGVPVYVAVNATADDAHVLFGFGAHVDPVITCVRALTDVAQFASSPPEPGVFRSGNAVEDAWLAEVTTGGEPWLAPTHLGIQTLPANCDPP